MKTWIKRALFSIAVIVILLMIVFTIVALTIGPVATGYTAKMIGSGIFVMGQSPAEAWRDFPDNPIKPLLKFKVDRDEKSVTAALAGIVRRKALFREGYGVTLVPRKGELVDLPAPPERKLPMSENLPFPAGELVDLENLPKEIDREKLQIAVDNAFTETNPENPKQTRAIVIIYKDRIIAERYAPGYDKTTRFLGWSMSKSVINALLGILVRQGKLAVNERAFVPEWQDPDDPRHEITVDQLVRMSSGLHFVEEYKLRFGVTRMLYDCRDKAAFAANEPLLAPPDSVWYYSSGTANILSRAMRHYIGGSLDDYHEFYRNELFDPLNMQSVIFEPDATGILVGSSFMFAAARDWARFGLLYLQDGIWMGKRILPAGWIEYTTTPTPNAPLGKYGALFWLNAGSPHHSQNREYPDLPDDLFYANGHDGQRVVIIPSRDLVLVRLGVSRNRAAWDLDELVRDVLKAFPEK
jgi:CubicO group peptidase (beta-lactamase class C family)